VSLADDSGELEMTDSDHELVVTSCLIVIAIFGFEAPVT